MPSTQDEILVLQGGRVIDPANGFDDIADVVTKGDTILEVGPGVGSKYPDASIRNVEGKVVTPGLIDIHTHCFTGLGDFCLPTDLMGVDSGVPVIVDAGTTSTIPHAWKAGPQTLLLRKQLEAMPNGGTFVISPPVNPFRCPPGSGERISLVANYFKKAKPKSKILVLDPKKKFSKQGLFKEGWAKLYGGMIEYRNADNDGVVRRVDPKTRMLYTDFDEYKGDVVNFIPSQRAGKIAQFSGLTDKTEWCPVDHLTFESKLVPGVHVIGDATIASPMPKSGFAASTQAKVCADAVVNLIRDKSPGTPKFVNTCYSLVNESYGISVAMVYGFKDGKIIKIKGSGGVSPSGTGASFREKEANYARGWYESISNDIWG